MAAGAWGKRLKVGRGRGGGQPWRSLLFSALVCALSGSALAQAGPRVVVSEGTLEGLPGEGVERFLGVPYAAPPVGALRWQPPREPPSWPGVRAAKWFGARCLQDALAFGEEDCLTLNVFRPAGARNTPVMVFIHGGFFTGGRSGLFDGSVLARDFGVTVVTVNYRLSVTGFLAASGVADGNNGLMDVVQALRWLRVNAGALGVDGGNVTVFGQSAGAAALCALLVAPEARGLFHKAILQSGSCVQGTFIGSVEGARVAGDLYTRSFGCGAEDLSVCLRHKTAAELMKQRFLGRSVLDPVPLYPVYGTPFLPLKPLDAFKRGDFARVPVLVGVNRSEARVFEPYLPASIRGSRWSYLAGLGAWNPGNARRIAGRYPLRAGEWPFQTFTRIVTDRVFACPSNWWANTASAFTPVFAYEFSDPDAPSQLKEQPVNVIRGAFHGAELPFVLGSPVPEVADPAQFSAAQRQLSRQMQEYWASFARTGTPSAQGGPDWPPFTPASPQVMTFTPGGTALQSTFAADHQCDFWDVLDGRNEG